MAQALDELQSKLRASHWETRPGGWQLPASEDLRRLLEGLWNEDVLPSRCAAKFGDGHFCFRSPLPGVTMRELLQAAAALAGQTGTPLADAVRGVLSRSADEVRGLAEVAA